MVKVGGGARHAGPQVDRLLDLVDGVAVTSPLVSGVLAYNHPRNMTVGGSKGSIGGNFAMEEADLLLAIGTRLPFANRTLRAPATPASSTWSTSMPARTRPCTTSARPLWWVTPSPPSTASSRRSGASPLPGAKPAPSRRHPVHVAGGLPGQKREWDDFKALRYGCPGLYDDVWAHRVLSQPAAIKVVTDMARKRGVVAFFDAGDVQANGFQVVEDDRLGRTFTETGASYMGFAVSAVLATAAVRDPAHRFRAMAVTGDGSFTMNPQVLIDGVAHGAQGCIVLLDNRRMGAISTLQRDHYGPGANSPLGTTSPWTTWPGPARWRAWPLFGEARPWQNWNRLWKRRSHTTGFVSYTSRCTGGPTL